MVCHLMLYTFDENVTTSIWRIEQHYIARFYFFEPRHSVNTPINAAIQLLHKLEPCNCIQKWYVGKSAREQCSFADFLYKKNFYWLYGWFHARGIYFIYFSDKQTNQYN